MMSAPGNFREHLEDIFEQAAAQQKALEAPRVSNGPPNSAEQAAARTRGQAIRAKWDRDLAHQGTLPENIWGERVGRLCRDFIDFASEHDFKGSTTLSHRIPKGTTWGEMIFKDNNEWSIEGYGVGGYITSISPSLSDSPIFKTSSPYQYEPQNNGVARYRQTNLPYNVFLCADNMLRLYTHGSVHIGSAFTPSDLTGAKIFTKTVGGEVAEAEPMPEVFSSPDITVFVGNETAKGVEPYYLSDLPIDRNGSKVTPSIGRFLVERGPVGYGEWFYDEDLQERRRLMLGGEAVLCFAKENIETIFTNHAKIIGANSA